MPLTWTLGKQLGSEVVGAPTGMHIDAATGSISWTPTRDQAGLVAVTVAVQNAAGSDFQDFSLEVVGDNKPGGGCGCGSGARGTSAPGLVLLALLGWIGVRRRD